MKVKKHAFLHQRYIFICCWKCVMLELCHWLAYPRFSWSRNSVRQFFEIDMSHWLWQICWVTAETLLFKKGIYECVILMSREEFNWYHVKALNTLQLNKHLQSMSKRRHQSFNARFTSKRLDLREHLIRRFSHTALHLSDTHDFQAGCRLFSTGQNEHQKASSGVFNRSAVIPFFSLGLI